MMTDHCIDDGRADYQFLHAFDEMQVKIKSTHFERISDCKVAELVEACYKECYELANPGNSGCIGGEITNDAECYKKVKYLQDESFE